jgi:hypothetical protein
MTSRRSRPRVKLSALPKFPADVVAGTGILIEKSGATFTFSLDPDAVPDVLGLEIGSDVQAWNGRLDDLSGSTDTGIWCLTAPGSAAARTLTQPAAGFTITNPGGVGGNPTFTLANDLAALEALSGTGFATRTGSEAWAQRSLTVSDGLTVTNPAGIAGDPLITLGAVMTPGGRLTFSSGVQVMTSDVTGATSHHYTPDQHAFIPIYDGTSFVPRLFSETSQLASDTTKSPAAAAVNSNYDVLAWMDGSTLRTTRSRPWTSNTARGTGSGTAELEFFGGFWVNKYDVTNGPVARRGTYLGSIRTDASGTFTFTAGGQAVGGGTGRITVWNAFNQVAGECRTNDMTNPNWSVTNTTWVIANNNPGIFILSGLPQHRTRIEYQNEFVIPSILGAYGSMGVSDDGTVAQSYSSKSIVGNPPDNTEAITLCAARTYPPRIGWRTYYPMNRAGAAAGNLPGGSPCLFYGGDVGTSPGLAQFQAEFMW